MKKRKTFGLTVGDSDILCLKAMFADGTNLNEADENDRFSIHFAIEKKQLEIVS